MRLIIFCLSYNLLLNKSNDFPCFFSYKKLRLKGVFHSIQIKFCITSSNIFMKAFEEFLSKKTQHGKELLGISIYQKDPVVEEAKNRLKILDDRLSDFTYNMNFIIKSIQSAEESSKEFSEYLVEADKKNGLKSRTIVNTISLFYETLNEDADSILLENLNGKVSDMLREQREVIDRLKAMKNERHDIRLLTFSYKDKVEKLSKSGDPKKLSDIRLIHQEKEEELEKITRKFVKCVTRLWNNQKELIEEPMQNVISSVFRYCRNSYTTLRVLMNTITPEEMKKDYLESQ